MEEEKLIEIRCPFKKKYKDTNRIFTCNSLCAKVYAPARGEAYCHPCKLAFEYEVDSQVSTHIKAKSTK